MKSGIDTLYIDDSVRPQDDLYRYLNGRWLDGFELPADRGVYGAFMHVSDTTQEQLRSIVESLAGRPAAAAAEKAAGLGRGVATSAVDGGACVVGAVASSGFGAAAAEKGARLDRAAAASAADAGAAGAAALDAQKLADLYASFMDEARIDGLGIAPLAADFAAIDGLVSHRDIPGLIAQFNRTGADAPFDIAIGPDPKDSKCYAVTLMQGGLGLPDRDYYLQDDGRFTEVRAQYLSHVQTMLSLAGDRNANGSAAAILRLETALAVLQWTRVANRDPQKAYNKIAVADLGGLMPEFAWPGYLQGCGILGKVDYLIVRQPSYFSGLDRLIAETPLAVWKGYFKWRRLSAAAPHLPQAFADERFAFGSTVLRGIPQNLPRWRRGLDLLDAAMGEAVGKLYVEKYFPPQNKARMETLVSNLLEAYRQDIETLDWMTPATKQEAQAKLAKLAVKIGYPAAWRDYGDLSISRNDLWGNVTRAHECGYRRAVEKLGRPVDRREWLMAPQTVNAYYDPAMNEIVFPAAILQPPFFDDAADDAMNYGAIVAVIGHEVSHGFDDQGSRYDADGNLRDWFTAQDHARFAATTQALVAQYAAYQPVAGYRIDGELTLGENIADNAGLALAYQAYRRSLCGKPAPVIDGFTGEQRFYLGWVQIWRGKVREDLAVELLKVDPHAPAAVRGTAPLLNQAGFYSAFGPRPGDGMYLPPEQRVIIW